MSIHVPFRKPVRMLTSIVIPVIPLMTSIVLLAQSTPGKNKPDILVKPKITITQMPTDPPGEVLASKPLKGTVSNAPDDSQVIAYALGDAGKRWYVQPWADHPYTSHSHGKWSTETHGGFEFAVLLVKPSYKPQATMPGLPQAKGDVLALARAKPGK